MLKRWASFILILLVVLSTMNVFADVQQGPEVYTITVTEDGGRYQLGNVELTFKKDSMQKDMEPVTFTVQLYAENGTPYIQFDTSVSHFAKGVMIKVNKGDVTLFDTATGQPIQVHLNNYNFKVEHFSRYIIQG
jgi:hypothetical protein